MHNFFCSTDSKNFQDEAHPRFIFNNVFFTLFGCISVANLRNLNKRPAGNFGQFGYFGFMFSDCSNED